MTRSSRPLPSSVGTGLARVLVPLWVLIGALFKAYHATPKNLPPTIIKSANEAGVDLMMLLWVLVGLELLSVGAMIFVPRLAQPMATFMLVCFCLVLIAELATGNFDSCGCLGAVTFPPWAMLLVDGSMLVGLLLSRSPEPGATTSLARWAAAGVWSAAGFAASAAMIHPFAAAPNGNGEVVIDDGGVGGRRPKALAPYYVADCDTWEGKRWEDLDLAQYMPEWPEDIDQGKRYVIFYGRTCDHCELLFELHFADPPVPTTIVAVPETKQGFDGAKGHGHLCRGCPELELPVGSDWVVTTPIVVALEDGVVRCAVEGEEPEMPTCLIWH